MAVTSGSDCDGDGLSDSTEVAQGSDPFDPCDPNQGQDCDDDFFIPQGFSPNGDGVNDLFVIRGINAFEVRTITFFNRWGNKVYTSDNYQNDWNGTNQFGLSVGNQLPVGTYYYFLELGNAGSDEREIYKGYVYLNR